MPKVESPPDMNQLPGEVLTLPEVAAFLRVSEDAVSKLVSRDMLPAQKIDNEWRFHKRSVVDWLRFGPRSLHEFRGYAHPWMFEHPVWEDLIRALEQRILSILPAPEQPAPKPGTKQAVLRHFGVFKQDGDLEEQLASLRARREVDES